MRVEKVTVSRTRKVNLGNFESAEILVSMTADVDSDESPLDVGGNLANHAASVIAMYGPKGVDERVSGGQPREQSQSEASVATAHPVDHLAVKVTGAKLKDDAEGRQWLKDHGFKFQGTDASWRGRIVRDPKEIAALNQWTKARNLEIEFAPVEG